MKMETLVMISALVLVALLGSLMAFNTVMGQHEQQLLELGQETDWYIACAYWTRMSLLPPPYFMPLEVLRVSSGTGYRVDPMGGAEEALHKGKDFSAPEGAPVFAVLSGLVVEHYLVPGWHNGKEYFGDGPLGAKIVLDHGGGLYSISAHFSKTEVREGQWIEAGQKIGEVGNTGQSTGPHLHFEIVVDPLRYLEER